MNHNISIITTDMLIHTTQQDIGSTINQKNRDNTPTPSPQLTLARQVYDDRVVTGIYLC